MVDKTAEQIEAAKDKVKADRDSIKVTMVEHKEETEETKEETKEVVEEKEEKVETHEETEEELEAKKAEAKTQREKDKIQKRIDREIGKRKDLEAEIAELKAKLAADPAKDVLTEEEVEKRAETKAQQKIIDREFANANKRLFEAGVKADKDFQKKVNAMAEDIGPIPGHWVAILDDLDNPGDVLVYLTNNTDEAEDLYSRSPAKAAVELTKLSAKIAEGKKPKAKEISKAPDPNEPLKGGAGAPALTLTGKESMEDYVRIRAEQVRRRREAKMGGR